MSENKQLAATLKSQDTEEWLDIYFTRPLGLLWARLFNRFGVHPNTVTIISIVLGAAAGVMFYFENLWLNVAGILLLIWANIYDSCDGQLARMTGKKTRLGRVLDGFAGDVWFFSIYFFICLRLMPVWGVWIWVLCAVAGFLCHGKQCALADYYRNVHLFFLKGEAGSELDNSRKLSAEYQQLRWKDDFVWKLFLYFYRNYTASQERMTPRCQSFLRMVREKYAGIAIPETLRADFRSGSLPIMPLTNILTFNCRAIILYISLLLGLPWIYPVSEITVFSVLFLLMRMRHEQLCRKLEESLGEPGNT